MQKLCCVRTRQHLCQFGLFCHNFTTVSPPILNHFWWELYQPLINQVIQQEDVCSEPPEPLSYSVFQSHFQGSSTSNTQKIFLPKPIWEKLSKDQQQMIIDHNRSLPKSGSTLSLNTQQESFPFAPQTYTTTDSKISASAHPPI